MWLRAEGVSFRSLDTESTNAESWWLLGAMTVVYVAFGVVVSSIAPMLPMVQEDLGASRSEMGFVLGAWTLIFIGTASFGGRFIDRFGLRLSILLAGFFIAASAGLRAAATDVTSLWLAVGLFGVGGPLISAGAPTLARRLFHSPERRRRAVSIYMVAPGLGGVLTLALTNTVLLPWLGSWRAVLVAESGFALAATAVWWTVATWLHTTIDSSAPAPAPAPAPTPAPASAAGGGADVDQKVDQNIDANGGTEESANRSGWASVRALLASSDIRLSLAIAFPVFFLNHGLTNWFPTLLAEVAELSQTTSANLVAASTLLGIMATLLVPSWRPTLPRGYLLAGLMVVVGIGLLVLAVAGSQSVATTVAATMLIGLRGGIAPIAVLLLMESEGLTPANSGLANGMWFSVGEVGGVSGPASAGVIADSSLGFGGVLALLTSLAWAGGAAIALSTRRRLRRG